MWHEFLGVLENLAGVLLGGTIGAAIINGINERKMLKMKHEYEKEDKVQTDVLEKLNELEAQSAAQSEALRFVLYDRIRHIGQAYIADEEVDFDDRRILRDMHRSYHNGLGGKGDLDKLMEAVDELPLKRKET